MNQPRLTGDELENFFKDFAIRAGILEVNISKLEDVVRLFESKLPYKFAKAERYIREDYPSASEWFHKILDQKALPPIREDIKEKRTNRLLDLVIATDAVVKVRGNDGIERKIAIDVTANFKTYGLQIANPGQQKINLQGLRCSEFIVTAAGRDTPGGERVFQVSNGWVFRQKGEDLTLDTRSDGREANRLRHRGIILEFKNGSLRGTLTLKDLEGLKKCVSGLQQIMQEQKNQESNLDI